jgi:hypothetical protein
MMDRDQCRNFLLWVILLSCFCAQWLRYPLVVSEFYASKSKNATVLSHRLGGEVDTDALEKYFAANPDGIAPGLQNRITTVP